ncbi:mechanosensitive ion channel protein 6-like [Populus alba x Populus x berolinensis]|uniref:Mechanosensitive ion channel protein n=1 Tax=Populus alba x Populus x berolinensis TaxID=444605 RepID=A0AAD6R393_9ROSI|nr:mechanosensitive ion channel protein 6-like [Populus alba x Populus x berolinensis]KAJ7001545.1 mechanosensitive ion channel protein 6-like [Populus alba x Populus x berolinensis]
MDFSLKKSFKGNSSFKHIGRFSGGGGGDNNHSISPEELPILHHHQSDIPYDNQQRTSIGSNYHNEVIVKVDNGNSSSEDGSTDVVKFDRAPSFGFTQNGQQDVVQDPPSRLIGQFLENQKTFGGGEITLDLDMEMDELKGDRGSSHESLPTKPSSRETRVSFEPSLSGGSLNGALESVRRRCKEDGSVNSHQRKQEQEREEVLKCSSNASFRRHANPLSRLKTKSRLIDDPSPQELEIMSGRIPKSGPMRSGMLSRVLYDEDDEDPFEDLKKVKILNLKLWKWEVLLLVLICGRLVSGWGIHLIVFFIERNFLLRKRVLYFVYGLRKGVQNCWWLGLVLLAWHFLFDKKVQRDTKSDFLEYKAEDDVERIAAEVRKLQNAGVTMPAELKASVFPPAKSGRLNPNRVMQKTFTAKSFKFSGKLSQKGEKEADDGITIDHLDKLNTKNISAWNMKRLMKIVRHGSLSTLDEQILGAAAEDESTTRIRSENEAKVAARKIFNNVARHGSKFIYLQDLMRFLEEDQAFKTMSFFEEESETSRIGKSSLKNWVVNAFRERRALALTLNDTKTAVNKLHQIINAIVGIVIVVISLVILGIAKSKFFVLLGSQVLVVSFVFGNTAKTLFESIIFLFVIHPFDVGDRCEIDGVQLIVEEMNILTTFFLRADNQKVLYPNSVLATKPIGNYYRSPDMGDSVEFHIHICTPAEKVALMKQRITGYIEGKKEHWYPDPSFVFKELVDLNKMMVAVWIRHRMNHQDMAEKTKRRALLLEEMVKIFSELDIQYRLFPIDINIRAMPPLDKKYLLP